MGHGGTWQKAVAESLVSFHRDFRDFWKNAWRNRCKERSLSHERNGRLSWEVTEQPKRKKRERLEAGDCEKSKERGKEARRGGELVQ